MQILCLFICLVYVQLRMYVCKLKNEGHTHLISFVFQFPFPFVSLTSTFYFTFILRYLKQALIYVISSVSDTH